MKVGKVTQPTKAADPAPYEGALDFALGEIEYARKAAAISRAQWGRDESQVLKLINLAQNLLRFLPPERRAIYAERLKELSAQTEPATKGGPVFDNVVRIFQHNSDKRIWTIPEVNQELIKKSVRVDAKAIANVLGYFARIGKMKRIARGHYFILGGSGLVTDEEIAGAEHGQTRITEHDV